MRSSFINENKSTYQTLAKSNKRDIQHCCRLTSSSSSSSSAAAAAAAAAVLWKPYCAPITDNISIIIGPFDFAIIMQSYKQV